MKTITRFAAIGFAVIAGTMLMLPEAAAAPRGKGGGGKGGGGSAALTVAESATLTFMREEEKLARDVYLFLFDVWGKRVFSNIAASEQSHMDALKRMLDKYGLPDPILEEGVFRDPELQDLYDLLVIAGVGSLEDALLVGALIEEVDIEDLELAIIESSKDDLDRVYENLMAGSVNHLRSFVGLWEDATGEEYEAQFLPQDVVDALLAGE